MLKLCVYPEEERESECQVCMCAFWLEGVVGVTAQFISPTILSCLPASSSVQAEGPISAFFSRSLIQAFEYMKLSAPSNVTTNLMAVSL
jgi:hypothetical protein